MRTWVAGEIELATAGIHEAVMSYRHCRAAGLGLGCTDQKTPSQEAVMVEQKNPYAAPSAPVADVHADQDRGEFISDGQSVPAGRGWEWWRRGFAMFLASPWMWML